MKGRVLPTVLASALLLLAGSVLSAQASECLECHADETPGIVVQWQDSKHPGVGVGCEGCHVAMEGDPSGYRRTRGRGEQPPLCHRCGAGSIREPATELRRAFPSWRTQYLRQGGESIQTMGG